MSAVDHEAAVAQLLAELGDTADAVADRLRALGIKGIPGDACWCPVASYLKRNGYEAVAVSMSDWGCALSVEQGYGAIDGDTPGPVVEFIARFDEGVYLDLVEVAG